MDTIKRVDILRIKGEEFKEEEDVVILEYPPFTIFVNDEEVITLLCSPNSLKELMVGFLFFQKNSYLLFQI